MTNRGAEASPLVYARVAGFIYLFTIIGSLLNVAFVMDALVIPGDVAATAKNIIGNELLFHIGIAFELVMSASVVVLALCLYVILRPVNRNLALLALCWRLAEAILLAVTVLISFIVLQILGEQAYLAAFETKQLQALVGVFLGVRTTGVDIVILFTGLGSIVFFYLFFKSRYIPRVLAAWGILTYMLIILYSLAKIVSPGNLTEFDMIVYGPGALFELIIGLWLLFRGVNIQPQIDPDLESA